MSARGRAGGEHAADEAGPTSPPPPGQPTRRGARRSGGAMGDWLGGWLAAVRIARREARRAKGRSALVIALIGLPIFGLTFAAVSLDSFRLTTEQEMDRSLGGADARIRWVSGGPVTQPVDGRGHATSGSVPPPTPVTGPDLRAVLPPGSRAVPLSEAELELRTAGGIGAVRAGIADLTDPVHQGRLVLRDGRAPAGPDEVAVTRPAAGRLGVEIGDPVVAADGTADWRVVGVVEHPDDLGSETVLFHPSAAGALRVEPTAWLVDTPAPVTWEQVKDLNRHGIVVRSRAVVLDPPAPEQAYPQWRGVGSAQGDEPVLAVGVVVAGLAMLEVVLLAGPAFAVGARRRQRDLALVGAAGGTPAQLRRIVLADGLVLGFAAAAAGIGLGVAAGLAGIPVLEEYVHQRRAGGPRLWPSALAGVAGLAVLTGLLAAVVPAAVAARQQLVTALAGRRGMVRAKRRWLLLGIALTATGGVVATAGAWQVDADLVLAGLVASQLGLALCMPALVGLVARTGRFLPLPARIALRDTARNRAAAAPAIAAVMAAVAGVLALGTFLLSDDNQQSARYVPVVPTGYAHVHYDQVRSEAVQGVTGGGAASQVEPADQAEPAAPIDPDLRAAVITALRGSLPTSQVVEVRQPACPAGTPAGSSCQVEVPVPEERRCPWTDIYHRRPLTDAEERRAIDDPRCDGIGAGMIISGAPFDTVVDDGAALPALTGADGDDLDAATAVLRDGGVVVTDPRLVVDGGASVEIAVHPPGAGRGAPASTEQLTVPAHVLSTGEPVPTVVLSPAAAARAGLDTQLAGVVAATTAEPTRAERDAARAALRAVDERLTVSVELAQGPTSDDATLLVLAAVAGLVALGAASIATGLAAADRRPDLATLASVGASPRIRRFLSLAQSGMIAGLGGTLGSVAGVGAAFAVLAALNHRHAGQWPAPDSYPLEVPWQALALVLVVVPVVAMLGAGLFTRSSLPIERRPG